MIKLSVVIITFNEEKNIERCLQSVKNIADDIVVIDSYSKDKTKEICQKHNVNFIERIFDGYSNQKNFGIDNAKYEYILSIDADEALSEQLEKSIIEIKNNWTHDAYSFNRLTNYCNQWIKYGGWYPDKKIRVWDSSKGKWGGNIIHEEIVFNGNVNIKHLNGDLLHYSYYSIKDHLSQFNNFTEIASNELFEKNKKVSFIKIFFSPIALFVKTYFFRLGFLDGFNGFLIAISSSYATFIKYAKLRHLYKNKSV